MCENNSMRGYKLFKKIIKKLKSFSLQYHPDTAL